MDDYNMDTYLDKDFNPHVLVEINIDNRWTPIDCVIDTGFNGDLVLPYELKKYFNNFLFTQKYIVGDGTVHSFNLFHGLLRVGPRERSAQIMFANSYFALVGIQFLLGLKLLLDLKDISISLTATA